MPRTLQLTITLELDVNCDFDGEWYVEEDDGIIAIRLDDSDITEETTLSAFLSSPTILSRIAEEYASQEP
jgi:hypothetical protein